MKKPKLIDIRKYADGLKDYYQTEVKRHGNSVGWVRETAKNWIKRHQYISIDGDFEHIVMDGDGRDLYQSLDGFNNDLSSEELGKLLVFVFNDYVKIVKEKNIK